jgi:hypothetical protein
MDTNKRFQHKNIRATTKIAITSQAEKGAIAFEKLIRRRKI